MAFKTPPPAPAASIPELLAQLPEGQLDATDIACLKALKACMHTLRVDDASTGWLFSQDVRLYFAIEMNNALASVIKTRIPRAPARPVGRPSMADDKKALVLASTTFKVHLNNLVAALRAFSTRMAPHWDADLVPPLRRSLVASAAQNVRTMFHELENAVPDDEELIEKVNEMNEHLTRFEQAVDNWTNNGRQIDSKNDGLHKHTSLFMWIDACRALAGANAIYLQRIKG